VWARVAALSFGGPAGQIAVMHRILVEEKRWVSEARFLHALNYCMLLPGPEAQQLATYVGWLLHRTKGGLTAGLLFVLPGFVSILALSTVYALYGDTGVVAALFFGLKPAVLAVVVEAVVRIGKRVLKNGAMRALAALAFVGIFFFGVPFPLIVLAAGFAGLVGGRLREDLFYVVRGHDVEKEASYVTDTLVAQGRPPWTRTAGTAAVWLAVWLVPLGALWAALGPGHVLVREGVFFSQAAMVTFGGAYSVLAYVAQQAVEVYGWLEPGEMLDGLGMAETTPGPLIQVVQFVGFLGAYRLMPGVDPLLAGVLGSVVTAWATFAPCFLWIFVGAPYVEHLRGSRTLSSALSAITAAVVGVVLNLAVWFGLHVLFGTVTEVWAGPLRLWVPDASTLDPVALVLAAGAFLALFRFKLGMLPTLAASAALGLLYHLLMA
jgi:chromate transporter